MKSEKEIPFGELLSFGRWIIGGSTLLTTGTLEAFQKQDAILLRKTPVCGLGKGGNLSSKVGPVPANLAYTHPPLFTGTSVKRINYRARLLTRYPRIVERTRKRGREIFLGKKSQFSVGKRCKKKKSRDFQTSFFFFSFLFML